MLSKQFKKRNRQSKVFKHTQGFPTCLKEAPLLVCISLAY